MKVLYSALLTIIDPKYCKFSSGDDICLHGKLQDILVVNNGQTEDVEGLSPIYDGFSSSITMIVEGKRGEIDYEKLKCQLFANIFLASITTSKHFQAPYSSYPPQ